MELTPEDVKERLNHLQQCVDSLQIQLGNVRSVLGDFLAAAAQSATSGKAQLDAVSQAQAPAPAPAPPEPEPRSPVSEALPNDEPWPEQRVAPRVDPGTVRPWFPQTVVDRPLAHDIRASALHAVAEKAAPQRPERPGVSAKLMAQFYEAWVAQMGMSVDLRGLEMMFMKFGAPMAADSDGHYLYIAKTDGPSTECFVVPNPKKNLNDGYPYLQVFFQTGNDAPPTHARPWLLERAAIWRDRTNEAPLPGTVVPGHIRFRP